MLLLALVLSCFAALAQATLSLTFPTNSSGWTSLIGPNQISWTTDAPANFTINLVAPESPDYSLGVAYFINGDSGSFYFTSATPMEAASGYVINLVWENGTTATSSQQFGVTSG
ncbi:hypothetical protein JCM24511_03716 [Saitozyma sp. JCM 24511]|nr:hypothetical protein JCM24511_03716 [Saitozyma sp. JCM 24511]